MVTLTDMETRKRTPPAWKRLAKQTKQFGSKSRLAEQAEISLSYLSRIASGKQTPSYPVALRLEKASGIPATEFLRTV